jgi:hypothetical protein
MSALSATLKIKLVDIALVEYERLAEHYLIFADINRPKPPGAQALSASLHFTLTERS